MNRRLSILAVFSGLFILYSFSSGPPTGRTGAPGEGLCTGCHTGGGPGLDGTVSISGLPSTIIGGDTYTITVTVTNPNGASQGAGFQMTALDENNLKAGTMTNPSSGSKVHSGGGREYHDHTARRSYSGGAASWTVDWTAPTPVMDLDVTMWAAGNITDSNPGFNSANDRIVTSNVTGTVLGAGAPLEVDIVSSTNVTCFGGNDGSATANATGGSGGYSYNWSNGQSGAVATNLSQGNYTVTATDSNGDMATEDVTISQPSSPTSILIISQQDVSCNGGSDGSVQVQASGNNGGFSYQWSNGQNGPFIANLRANTYTVTATDIEGCEETMDIEITEPEELEAEVTTEDANCTVDSSGFASVRPEGGTPPYDYSWSNGYSSSGATSEQDSLTPGDYTVEILDDNDCLLEVMLTIGQDTGFAIEVVRIDTPDCHQGSDGAIEIEISGGTAPFDIEWDNGDTTLSISGLTAGSYYVEVTDADGCIDSMNVEVPDRAPNVIEILDSTTVDCPEDSTTVRFTYSGGGWNGPSGDTISITGGVDTHFYMLTDPRNCMQTDTIIITHDDTIAPVIACPGDTTTSSCTFSYSLPDVEENCDSLAYNVMEGPEPGEIFPAGITVVTIEVRDEAGNADTCTFEVNVLNDLELLATTIKEARCAGDTAIYRLNGSGGSGDLRVISQGDTMTLDGDSLIVEVTEPTIFQLIDTTGCFDEISVGPDLTPLMVDSANVTQMSGTGTNDGRIEIFVSGGTPDYAYLWKNDIGTTVGDSMVLDSLSPGSYYCIVMDSNLCTVTSDTFVIELITAVNGVEQNVVNVFPNPFDTRITVESSREPILSLTIYNSRGEKLARVETYDKKFSYEFGDMTTGIYFIAVETENDLLIRKVLRQR